MLFQVGLLALAVVNAFAAAVPAPQLYHGPDCLKLINACKSTISSGSVAAEATWSQATCVLAAACYGSKTPVAGLLSNAWPLGTDPRPDQRTQTRVENTIFGQGGDALSLQNFIDAWYGQLSLLGGPYPPNADVVKSYFSLLQNWTGFCGKDIPWFNLADYFQYSAGVTTCSD